MKKIFLPLICLAAPLFMITGCSDNGPIGPAQEYLSGLPESAQLSPVEPIQFAAKIKTVDQNTRMLTLEERPEIIIALNNCEIVRLNNGQETPIPFEDVGPGDEAQFCCNRYENNYMYAHRIRLYGDAAGECYQYDVAFRDTITAIDYGAGTFTVANRSETINVDEYTVIWTRTLTRPRFCNTIKENNSTSSSIGYAGKASPTNFHTIGTTDTELEFTDLNVGYVVEVKAMVVDENNLLAVVIKVAESSYQERKCVEFTATLETVDCENRTVTFVEEDWLGEVCNGAILSDADGEPLTLCDFTTGQTVWVKGHEIEEGVLKICIMTLQ